LQLVKKGQPKANAESTLTYRNLQVAFNNPEIMSISRDRKYIQVDPHTQTQAEKIKN